MFLFFKAGHDNAYCNPSTGDRETVESIATSVSSGFGERPCLKIRKVI